MVVRDNRPLHEAAAVRAKDLSPPWTDEPFQSRKILPSGYDRELPRAYRRRHAELQVDQSTLSPKAREQIVLQKGPELFLAAGLGAYSRHTNDDFGHDGDTD